MGTTEIATPGGRQDAIKQAQPSTAADAGADSSEAPPTERAVLGGGCFWCLEAVYNELRGVERVVSGLERLKVPARG